MNENASFLSLYMLAQSRIVIHTVSRVVHIYMVLMVSVLHDDFDYWESSRL